jgi:hypothetical protein
MHAKLKSIVDDADSKNALSEGSFGKSNAVRDGGYGVSGKKM